MRKIQTKREWLKRYILNDDSVILWKYKTLYKVESCIDGVQKESTVGELDYEDALKRYDSRVEELDDRREVSK